MHQLQLFHSFFSIPLQDRGTYPSSHILSVLICGHPGQQSRQFLYFSFLFFFFFVVVDMSGLLGEIQWSACISKSHRILCVLFSRTGAGLCVYHLLVWSKLNFLRISQWITLQTQLLLLLLLLLLSSMDTDSSFFQS